jgi:hypothetical protein
MQQKTLAILLAVTAAAGAIELVDGVAWRNLGIACYGVAMLCSSFGVWINRQVEHTAEGNTLVAFGRGRSSMIFAAATMLLCATGLTLKYLA